MQKLWMILLFTGLLMACQPKQQKKDSNEKEKSTQVVEVQELVLDVKGMTCTGCEKAIENGLMQVDGVVEVKASHKNEKVTLKVEKDKLNKEEINRKIESIGYTVKN